MRKTGYVYRFYDENDDLLYVGLTSALANRVAAHKRGQPWADEIARCISVEYATREEAAVAEAQAIRDEHPKYNQHHNGLKARPSRTPEELMAEALVSAEALSDEDFEKAVAGLERIGRSGFSGAGNLWIFAQGIRLGRSR